VARLGYYRSLHIVKVVGSRALWLDGPERRYNKCIQNFCRVAARKTEKEIWKGYIKMDLREIGCDTGGDRNWLRIVICFGLFGSYCQAVNDWLLPQNDVRHFEIENLANLPLT
jgi:hypothetical protein